MYNMTKISENNLSGKGYLRILNIYLKQVFPNIND